MNGRKRRARAYIEELKRRPKGLDLDAAAEDLRALSAERGIVDDMTAEDLLEILNAGRNDHLN
jgi:hypothetical protein